MEHLLETIIAVLIGGAITWLCSWWYYRRAARDLENEAARLHEMNDKMWERLQGVPSFAGRKPAP